MRYAPGLSIESPLFSVPGLAKAVLTWSRPWNGTGERNASTAPASCCVRVDWFGADRPIEKVGARVRGMMAWREKI